MYTKTLFYKKLSKGAPLMVKIIPALVASLLLTGCVPVLIGAGVVTGYVLSNDAVSGTVNIMYRDLWDLCIEQLETQGAEIYEATESAGVIKSRIGDINVAVKITTVSEGVQRLKISARKFVNLVPKPYVAQDIFFNITKELE